MAGRSAPGHAAHSSPPVIQFRPRVTTTATVKKVAVTATLSGDAAAQPDIPCPDVHPPAHRDPNSWPLRSGAAARQKDCGKDQRSPLHVTPVY